MFLCISAYGVCLAMLVSGWIWVCVWKKQGCPKHRTACLQRFNGAMEILQMCSCRPPSGRLWDRISFGKGSDPTLEIHMTISNWLQNWLRMMWSEHFMEDSCDTQQKTPEDSDFSLLRLYVWIYRCFSWVSVQIPVHKFPLFQTSLNSRKQNITHTIISRWYIPVKGWYYPEEPASGCCWNQLNLEHSFAVSASHIQQGNLTALP